MRHVCTSCRRTHFRNPAVATVAVVVREMQVLLIRRREGLAGSGAWSLPGGFVDHDEDVRTATSRELHEETGLVGIPTHVIDVRTSFDDPHKPTIVVWFAVEVNGGTLRAGDDATDAAWIDLGDLPPLAFDGDTELLTRITQGSLAYPRLADDQD